MDPLYEGPLDTGSYARIFKAGPRMVWRLEYLGPYRRERRVAPENIPYSRYVMALANGQLNHLSPHAPRIKIHVIFKDGVATLMERLDKSVEHLPRNWDKAPKTSNDRVGCALYDTLCYLSHLETLPASFELYVENIIDARLGSADFHGGNIMLRGDTLVVTDPVC